MNKSKLQGKSLWYMRLSVWPLNDKRQTFCTLFVSSYTSAIFCIYRIRLYTTDAQHSILSIRIVKYGDINNI